MNVGAELFALARAKDARSIFVVGTGKNVGKTVTMRAIYEAACAAGIACGLTSIGRDGEAVDVSDALPKPRLWLHAPTVVATARDVLPVTPASEILALAPLHTAAGRLVLVRVAESAHYELVGPPTASGVRETVDALLEHADVTIVDGAIDRVAALAGGDDAIVVACGAGAANTVEEAVDAVGGLVKRLSIAAYDPLQPSLHIDGALTAARAAGLLQRHEQRQVVVRDPTQIALGGRAAERAIATLAIRCERPLRVVGVTVASIGREHNFEPRAFAQAVAAQTGLPTFDVYAGTRASSRRAQDKP